MFINKYIYIQANKIQTIKIIATIKNIRDKNCSSAY